MEKTFRFKLNQIFFVGITISAFMLVCFYAYAEDIYARVSITQYDFPGLKQTISLDLQEMDIVETLKYLAAKGNLNIVTGNNISGRVNLLLTDVTIGDVLDIVLVINNLAFEIKGNIIKVMSASDYESLYGESFYDLRVVETVHLKYAATANVGTMLGSIKSKIGKIIYDEGTGTIVMVDTPDKIEQMREIIDKTEMPTVTRVYPTVTETFTLQYAKTDEVSEKITPVLTPEVGTMQIDNRTSRVIVTDLPHIVEKIKGIIEAFDEKTEAVFIEAKIVQVNLSDHFKWGIDWDQISNTGSSFSVHPEVDLAQSLASGGSMTVASTTADLNAVLEALDTLEETRIISNPHLSVVDGQEAKIVVAKQQPYAVSTSTLSEGTTTTATDITFVDIGVTLTVTPTINQDEFITMNIKSEISEFVEYYTYGENDTEVPVVETRNAETTVMVKNGTTIIIAGLIKDEKIKTENKVPLLGDLPFIGKALFRDKDDKVERTETIVFLTPRIITGEEYVPPERHTRRERFPRRRINDNLLLGRVNVDNYQRRNCRALAWLKEDAAEEEIGVIYEDE